MTCGLWRRARLPVLLALAVTAQICQYASPPVPHLTHTPSPRSSRHAYSDGPPMDVRVKSEPPSKVSVDKEEPPFSDTIVEEPPSFSPMKTTVLQSVEEREATTTLTMSSERNIAPETGERRIITLSVPDNVPDNRSPTVHNSSPSSHQQPTSSSVSDGSVCTVSRQQTERPTDTGTGLATTQPLDMGPPSLTTSPPKARPRRWITGAPIDSNAPLCLICPSPSTIVCKGCKAVHYCSEDCKQLDTKAHDVLCSKWEEFQLRPGAAYQRAIYYPESVEHGDAQFVWLQFWHSKTQDGVDHEVPQLLSYFLDFPEDERQVETIDESDVLCRKLERSIKVVRAEQCFPVERNNCVAELIDSKFSKAWKGPILAFGASGEDSMFFKAHDLDISDHRHVLDFLGSRQSTAIAGDARYYGRTIRGVRINCDGDRKRNISDEYLDDSVRLFEDVRVPISHRLFSSSKVLPIPAAMGIRVLSARYPRRKHFEEGFRLEHRNSPSSTRCKDDYNDTYRDLSVDWLIESDARKLPSLVALDHPDFKPYYPGSVILARQDQKPLTARHLETLWRYNKRHLEGLMTTASEIYGDRDRTKVDEAMTKEEFTKFYTYVATTFSHTDREQPSPYGVKRRRGSLKCTEPGRKVKRGRGMSGQVTETLPKIAKTRSNAPRWRVWRPISSTGTL